VVAAKATDGEGEEGVLLSQELGKTEVVSGEGGGDANSSTSLVDARVPGELASHEKEEGEIEEGEEDDQGDVDPQGSQEEEEGDDEPGSQKDSESVGEFTGGISVSSTNTKVRDEEGGKGQPETTVRSESSCAERVAGGEFPHSSSELSQTADETGHADDSVRDGNTASLDVEHGKDKGGAREGEETERARVGDDPQLWGSVVDVGVSRKRRSMLTTGAVVMFIANGARVLDGTFLVGNVAHGSDVEWKVGDDGLCE